MSHNSSRRPECIRPIADDGPVAISPYVMSFECERFYQGWRYYWMICAAREPDELVSWGYASTPELAEAAARNEVNKLVAGLTRDKLAETGQR
jgi:hypothetical protein